MNFFRENIWRIDKHCVSLDIERTKKKKIMKPEEKLQTKSISDLKAIMDYLKERMDRATRMGKGWEFETLFNMRETVEGVMVDKMKSVGLTVER